MNELLQRLRAEGRGSPAVRHFGDANCRGLIGDIVVGAGTNSWNCAFRIMQAVGGKHNQRPSPGFKLVRLRRVKEHRALRCIEKGSRVGSPRIMRVTEPAVEPTQSLPLPNLERPKTRESWPSASLTSGGQAVCLFLLNVTEVNT